MKKTFFTVRIDGRDPFARLLVTDQPEPVFSLRLLDGAGHISGFSVALSDEDGALVWRSGFIELPRLALRYAGPALRPKTAYQIEFTIRCPDGAEHALQAGFETGFLLEPWQAKWIEPAQLPAMPEEKLGFDALFLPGVDDGKVLERLRPAQKLTREFHCRVLPRRARLYASAHGIYELRINGQRLGDALLMPETSAYAKQLYYQSYDPLPLLREGENDIEVLLADGWWIGRIGISGESCQYGDKLGFLMQLELFYPDGSAEMILSDRSFQGRRSHIDYADLFVGERHDYSRGDEPFQPCLERAFDMSNLVAQPIQPVVALRELSPAFRVSPKGELIADFSQVVAGVADLVTDAPRGTEITLEFSEVLDGDGNFFHNIIGRNKNQTDVVVCGDGPTIFKPRFTYHGFRYVRITGVPLERIKSLTCVVFGTELRETGSFSCSDERINQLQANIRWSTRGNMLSIPTDCPQREKMGWTGDILAFAGTAAYNFDMETFLRAWLRTLRLEQRPDGEVPNIAPCIPAQDVMDRERSGYNSSPAWGDACVLVPLALYRCYGDMDILRENVDMMRRWLRFVEGVAALEPEGYAEMTPEQRARNPFLWSKGHQFGDWLIPSLRNRGHSGVMAGVEATYRVVGSCFYAVTVRAFLEVLGVLESAGAGCGQGNEIDHYETLLQSIRAAVRAEYIADDGRIEGDLQGLYVMALYAGIGDAALREKMAARLAELIRENGNRLDTGFVSVPYLLDVLADNGYRPLAYQLLMQENCPSWLYMVKNGATTIWENWAAIRPDGTVSSSSYNHYALGSVGDWLYRRAAGIEPAAPGYRAIRFAPLFDIPLKSVSASLLSPYGRISSAWEKRVDTVAWTLEVPKNCSAAALVPGCDGPREVMLAGGQHHIEFPMDAVPAAAGRNGENAHEDF